MTGLAWRAAAAALLAGMAVTGFYAVHTGFGAWDDEGFVLLSLKQFAAHGHLYDEVYSRYGPLYHELWGGLFALTGRPVSHDAGRLIVLAQWVATSAVLGAAARRLTGSMPLALAVTALSFGVAEKVTSEPMHPGVTICLLLALLALAITYVPARAALVAVGALVAALALVKVNVGLFAAAGLAMALWPRWAFAAVALPWLLMSGELEHGWVRAFALEVSGGVLAMAIALRGAATPRLPLRPVVAGAAAVTGAVTLGALATGSSPGRLLDGAVLEPVHSVGSFVAPLPVSWVGIALALCAPFAALLARRYDPGPLGRAVAGAALLLTALGGGPGVGLLGLGPALAWIAALRSGFERAALAAIALLQLLHAYPVASSQLAFGRILFPLVGALCLAAAVRERRLWAAGAVALAVWAAAVAVVQPYREHAPVYRADAALPFPGAERVRVPRAEAAQLTAVVDAVRASGCSRLVSLPGLASFNLWTGLAPPDGFSAPHWWSLIPPRDQARTAAAAERAGRLCLVRSAGWVTFWQGGRPLPQTPMVRFLARTFPGQGTAIGPYEVLVKG